MATQEKNGLNPHDSGIPPPAVVDNEHSPVNVPDASGDHEQRASKIESSPGGASPPDSANSESDAEQQTPVPVAPVTPRPSITAVLRRGSFYGDATPRASIADILATNTTNPRFSTDTSSSMPDSDTASIVSEIEEDHFTEKWRVYIMGFFQGLLERLELMAILPGSNTRKDTSLNLAEFADGLPELAAKTNLLHNVNLIKYHLGAPSKYSKFAKEVTYFIEVVKELLKEVDENGTVYKLVNRIEEHKMNRKRFKACLEHLKQLKENIEMLKNIIEAERQAHKEAKRQWNKDIEQGKLELKELRKQNMIEYRYKADVALAKGDLSRRNYEVRLAFLREENLRLKDDLEVEKKVHEASVEFLKKQNMELREEAVALQAKIEVDTHNMDHMLEKMRVQNKEKAAILAELEPRYLARQAELEAERLEAIRKQEEFFANQGQIELQTFAALKIQRIWRGYLVRKVWKKVLRKLKRKRLAAKKKKAAQADTSKKKGKKR